jgi:hypothetical protein
VAFDPLERQLSSIPLSFAIFELLAYAMFGACLWHAFSSGPLRRARLIELLTGVVYGLTLEVLTLLQFHSYQYGHFLLMLGPVPFAVGVGWGIILYSAMALVDALPLPVWAACALVALLGLNIDLSMDAVAIRLHMWTWLRVGYDQQWFGVPYANFYAWFIVLCSCSALLWLVRPLTSRPGWRGPLAALGVLLGSVLILVLLDELEVQYTKHGGIVWLPIALLGVAGIAAVVWGTLAKRSPVRSPAGEQAAFVPLLVPLFFHLFFLTLLLVAGFERQLPMLLVISLAMLTISLALHLRLFGRRGQVASSPVQARPVS